MISFSQFLQESRSAPLYHATPLFKLPEILQRGNGLRDVHGQGTVHFRGMKSASRQMRTVSTSRSLHLAKRYGQSELATIYAIIVLDQQKLSYQFKIIPYDYFQTMKITGIGHESGQFYDRHRRSEAEEAIVLPNDSTGIDLQKYAIKVILPSLENQSMAIKYELAGKLQQIKEKLDSLGISWEQTRL